MKTILLIGGSMLLFYSCIELSDTESIEVLSDEEMKARTEVEEIDFETGEELKEVGLKDSMSSEGTSKGSMAPSVEKVAKRLPLIVKIQHSEEVHVKLPASSDESLKPIRLNCIPGERLSTPDSIEYELYDFPEIEAQYPGGIQELKTFISDNLIYPDVMGCYEGRVYVSFIVEKDGCITHGAVMRGGISKELNEEALRVIRKMPKWIPAQNNGKVVAARVRLPISFTLN